MNAFAYLGIVALLTAALFAVCFILGALIRLLSAVCDLIFPPKNNP